jgi:hypothetical protein
MEWIIWKGKFRSSGPKSQTIFTNKLEKSYDQCLKKGKGNKARDAGFDQPDNLFGTHEEYPAHHLLPVN